MAQEGMPRSTVCAGTGQPKAKIDTLWQDHDRLHVPGNQMPGCEYCEGRKDVLLVFHLDES